MVLLSAVAAADVVQSVPMAGFWIPALVPTGMERAEVQAPTLPLFAAAVRKLPRVHVQAALMFPDLLKAVAPLPVVVKKAVAAARALPAPSSTLRHQHRQHPTEVLQVPVHPQVLPGAAAAPHPADQVEEATNRNF